MNQVNSNLILFEGRRIVVVATGFNQPSVNRKTGPMIQTWILARSIDPISAVVSGRDKINCLDCPLSHFRGCYVDPGRGPQSVYLAYKRGAYRKFSPDRDIDLFRRRPLRFGAYGEPIFIPLPLMRQLTSVASVWTGYTHQWRNPAFAAYKEFLMASCTPHDYREAEALGWRAFVMTAEHVDGLMQCPASKEYREKTGRYLNCDQCGQCSGTSQPGRSVQILAHGHHKNKALRHAALAA